MRFTLIEIMLVTAAGIGRHTGGELWTTSLGAVSIGLTAAGPGLLWLRHRNGTLVGKWGVGEIAWFWLGIYFLLLVAWNLIGVVERAEGKSWLLVACAFSTSMLFAIMLIGMTRLLTISIGAAPPSGRAWFVRRWTNVAGIVLMIWLAGLGLLLLY